ncbi:MAG: ECF-type sigma factor [Rhodothermales bacterium]|nr:ECF-type sigma factor [Rhodothermales bacterium]
MPPPSPDTVPRLIAAARAGDAEALDALFTAVYGELRRLAHVVRQGRGSPTLNTTALVHEAYARLVPSEPLDVESRAHFFRLAARAMRFVLTDYARRRAAEKRGGGALVVSFDERVHKPRVQAEEVLALDDALTRLEALDARQAQVVECRFFAGLTVEETAAALGVGAATVKRDWRAARAWLTHALQA